MTQVLVLTLLSFVVGGKLGGKEEISVHQLPKEIAYKGVFKGGIRYDDKSGEHIVLITENAYETSTAEFSAFRDGEYVDGTYSNAELFAYHYDVNGSGEAAQTWRVYDFSKECSTDVVARFLDDTFQITDLDDDGVAEIWLVYVYGCRGDVGPLGMKIIMYEGRRKFAMRGEQKIVYAPGDEYGGEYKFDSAFNDARVFRDFAKNLWDSNCKVRMGE